MAHILLIAILIYMISVTNTADTECTKGPAETLSDPTQDAIITSFLNNSKYLMENFARQSYAALKTSCSKPIDCASILEANLTSQSGIYRIWPRSRAIEGFIEVYCDMDDEGGGWTVIQRRGDFGSGNDYFYQDWNAYKRGFGYLNKDFWLGNENIFAVTSQRLNTVKFVLSDFMGNTVYATYDDFWIEDEIRNYAVHVSGYRGNAGDSFTYHDGAQFTTKDRDNDNFNRNCAISRKGAWWFKACYRSHLNGWYVKGTERIHNDTGVFWSSFRGFQYSLKDTVIKIRPEHCTRKF